MLYYVSEKIPDLNLTFLTDYFIFYLYMRASFKKKCPWFWFGFTNSCLHIILVYFVVELNVAICDLE